MSKRSFLFPFEKDSSFIGENSRPRRRDDGAAATRPPSVVRAKALPVANLRRRDAEALDRLACAVRPPAGRLVEAAGARVVLEHPQRRLGVLLREALLGPGDEGAARAARPLVGIDVDREELAHTALVAARSG